MRHACLEFYIIYNIENKFINTHRSKAYRFIRAAMTTGAMHSQNYSYFGSSMAVKENAALSQPLDFPYSPCRMQSPNYYNQSPLPNFMSAMPQGNHGQMNGYTAEPTSYPNAPMPGPTASPISLDHQGYYSPAEANQNCSFHQYAWLKSTSSSTENWWHNAAATG